MPPRWGMPPRFQMRTPSSKDRMLLIGTLRTTTKMQNCPSCQSDQFKKLALIHAEGTSTSAGVGVGIAPGGLGAGVSAGVSTTKLAASCAPPVKDEKAFANTHGHSYALIFFVPLMIAGFYSNSISEIGWYWWVWGGIGLLLAFDTFVKFEKTAQAQYEAALAEYDRTVMCTRCGTRFQLAERVTGQT